MEGNGALFNPGFLGANFLWWVGQVADDKEWRSNIKETKIKDKEEIPGWGYRYKVRIIGLHDQQEETLKSDQLPWAQVMYPITAGGGQASAWQTPAIRQGNFVFGFFLDAQDQQVPVIMGVLGANAQVDRENSTGAADGNNFSSQSGYGGTDPDPDKKPPDSDLTTEQPGAGQAATLGSPTATNLETAKDKKKEKVLKKKHPLACPDPIKMPPMKGIQTVLENLTKKIQEYQKALNDYAEAVSSVTNSANDLLAAINDASCEIAKFLMTILQQLRDFITNLHAKILRPVLKLSQPTFRIELLDKSIKALEIINCLFNKIGLDLCKNTEKSVKDALNRRAAAAGGGTPVGDVVLPPLPPDDYYYPDPICSVEEIVGDLIGENINDIVQAMNAGMQPIFDDVNANLNDYGMGSGSAPSSVPSRGSGAPFQIPSINVPNIPGLETAKAGISGAAALAGGGEIGDVASNVANLAGIAGFDIGGALSFISAVMEIFSCDPRPKCSPNDTHTMKEGGSGKPSKDQPSPGGVPKRAAAAAQRLNAASSAAAQSVEQQVQSNPSAQATSESFTRFVKPSRTIQPGEGGGA